MIRIFKPLLLVLLLTSATAFCQEPDKPKAEQPKTAEKPVQEKVDIGLDGMLGLSVGDNAVGINVGGPSLKFRYKNIKVGVGAFPSLIILDDKASPRLAVSPIVEYKKWMLITPYYGYDSKDKMIWTFGLGYKFK